MNSTTIEITLCTNVTRISAAYKQPQNTLDPGDFDLVTTDYDWFIVVGDLIVKHPTRNSYCTKPVDQVMQFDYSVVTPDTVTHLSGCSGHRLDVFDISLVKFSQYYIEFANINGLIRL